MTTDEIIEMAKEAGFGNYAYEAASTFGRFAALVAAKEREACAQVAMEFRRGAGDPVCGEVATAVRERNSHVA